MIELLVIAAAVAAAGWGVKSPDRGARSARSGVRAGGAAAAGAAQARWGRQASARVAAKKRRVARLSGHPVGRALLGLGAATGHAVALAGDAVAAVGRAGLVVVDAAWAGVAAGVPAARTEWTSTGRRPAAQPSGEPKPKPDPGPEPRPATDPDRPPVLRAVPPLPPATASADLPGPPLPPASPADPAPGPGDPQPDEPLGQPTGAEPDSPAGSTREPAAQPDPKENPVPIATVAEWNDANDAYDDAKGIADQVLAQVDELDVLLEHARRITDRLQGAAERFNLGPKVGQATSAASDAVPPVNLLQDMADAFHKLAEEIDRVRKDTAETRAMHGTTGDVEAIGAA